MAARKHSKLLDATDVAIVFHHGLGTFNVQSAVAQCAQSMRPVVMDLAVGKRSFGIPYDDTARSCTIDLTTLAQKRTATVAKQTGIRSVANRQVFLMGIVIIIVGMEEET